MAIDIKTIPTLRTKAAIRFAKDAEATEAKRYTVDFSHQMKVTESILKKAKML